MPAREHWLLDGQFYLLVANVILKLNKTIKNADKGDWGTRNNKERHIKAYKCMLRNMNRIKKEMDEYTNG